jgi:hypothetical protein
MKFICTPCKLAADYKTGKHGACVGGTWCDCQHGRKEKDKK